MALLLAAGAALQCTMGLAPSVLSVLPINRVLAGPPIANIMDSVPFLNIPPFGMCTCPANPAVAAATAAALGVPTPAPCIPTTAGPWVPGVPTVMVGNLPVADLNCKLICCFGGVISALQPGQMIAMGP
jgi:hypothetical protein